MKKLKKLTTSTAIALASVGGTAFAQEATISAPVDTTAVNEPALVSKPAANAKPEVKKSSDVKPALDAQASTVKQVEAESETAKAEATSANQAVTTTETALTSAKEDLKSAEAVKANATEENITATKAKQDANVKAQEANQKATEASTEAIKAQTETVASETANVASATSKKAEADKTVTAKEANVKSAEDALNGSGLGEAKASLAQAEKDIEQANANISSATKAVETAKKADSNRAEAIKQATNNVNVKNDALKLAKEMMDANQNKVDSIQTKADATASKEKEAQTALHIEKAKLSKEKITTSNVVYNLTAEEKVKYGFNKDQVTFKDAYEYWKKNWTDDASELLQKLAIEVTKKFNVKIDESDSKRTVDINNLTKDQIIEISNFYANLTTELAKLVGQENHPHLDQDAIDYSKQIAKEYEKRGTSPLTDGHLPYSVKKPIEKRNDLFEHAENLAPVIGSKDATNMFDLKHSIITAFRMYSFFDKSSKWGHLTNNINAKNSVAMTVANINGDYWFVNTFATETKRPINLNQNIAQLEAKLAEAQKQNSQAQTALTNAQAKLQAEENKLTALQAEQAKLHAEKDKLVSDAKAIATELSAYLNADKNLADAQAKVADLETKLTQAKSAAKLAQDKLDAVTTKLKAEQAKLTEIQKEFDKLLDLENKAKDNVVATLPDGTVVAVPRVDSNSNTLPAENNEETVDKSKTDSQSGKDVTLDEKEDVVAKDKEETKDKQQTYSAPAVKAGADEKVTYSRVERAKSLPNTGESSSVAMLVLGAILGAFGLVTVRRKN